MGIDIVRLEPLKPQHPNPFNTSKFILEFEDKKALFVRPAFSGRSGPLVKLFKNEWRVQYQ